MLQKIDDGHASVIKNRRILISNFFSLSGMQVVNAVLPLIAVPYLVRIIGPERFGVISFSQALVQYFVLITDYGFNFTATRAIAIDRGNQERISDIVNAVLMTKMVFMVLCFLVLCSAILTFDRLRTEGTVYLFTFGVVIGNVLFPSWLFQGMEEMKEMAILNTVSKIGATASFFFFVQKEDHYVYIPLINSLGMILASLLSLMVAKRRFHLRLGIPPRIAVKQELRDGWHVFISSMTASLYNNSNTFVLGLFAGDRIVGYYSAGEKIVLAVNGLFLGPVSQTLYPHVSRLAAESKNIAANYIRRSAGFIGVPLFFVSLALFLFAPEINALVLGREFRESVPVMRILSFVPFFVGISNVFAIQGLYAFGFQAAVVKFVTRIAVAHLISVSLLTAVFSLTGTAVALLFSEALVAACSFYFFRTLIARESAA